MATDDSKRKRVRPKVRFSTAGSSASRATFFRKLLIEPTKVRAEPASETPGIRPVMKTMTFAGGALFNEINTVADLGREIHKARLAMDLTQQQFADIAGVGRRFVSELEAGKDTLEIGKVLKVCKAAGIDLHSVSR